jgi:hypothetical protein
MNASIHPLRIVLRPKEAPIIELSASRLLTLRPLGARGPQGPAGSAVDTATVGEARIADGNVGGHRAVIATAVGVAHANASNVAHARKVYGITLGAADSGDEVQVVTRGRMQEAGWNWTPDAPIFFNGAGVLTQTVPTDVYVVRVGTALSATVIFVEIGEPIIIN